MIQKERLKFLNDKPIRNRKYVLFWMQQSQRSEFNHALEYAIDCANEFKKPLIVFFGITDNFPGANERHYYFMLQGLKEVNSALEARGIKMVIRHISPDIGVVELAQNADVIVVDRGYLKIQRQWRKNVADKIDCQLVQVESDVIVPVETASPKEEYAAATFRPKINRQINEYLIPIKESIPSISSLDLKFESFSIEDIEKALGQLKIERSVTRVSFFKGGTSAAKKLLDSFVTEKLDRYNELRNDPTKDYLSNMSPYLHFGQISPLYIILKILDHHSPGDEAYLEELIVRRELSMNFIYYNDNYDSFNGLPDWCKKTLREHEFDPREYIYTLEQWERAQTHDAYWNAAQQEMIITGKMHGYMRMYWGKKILEWSKTPEEAFAVALYLNNKYELDGRDPNGFTGVAWCFGKHDRAWAERAIFGKIRYMNANGLRRKFDADGYVGQVNSITK